MTRSHRRRRIPGHRVHRTKGTMETILSLFALGCLTLVISAGCSADPTGNSDQSERSAPWCWDACQVYKEQRDFAARRTFDAAMASCGSNVSCQETASTNLRTALARSRTAFRACTGKC